MCQESKKQRNKARKIEKQKTRNKSKKRGERGKNNLASESL